MEIVYFSTSVCNFALSIVGIIVVVHLMVKRKSRITLQAYGLVVSVALVISVILSSAMVILDNVASTLFLFYFLFTKAVFQKFYRGSRESPIKTQKTILSSPRPSSSSTQSSFYRSDTLFSFLLFPGWHWDSTLEFIK